MNELTTFKKKLLETIEDMRMLVEDIDNDDLASIKTIIDISPGLSQAYIRLAGLNTRRNQSVFVSS